MLGFSCVLCASALLLLITHVRGNLKSGLSQADHRGAMLGAFSPDPAGALQLFHVTCHIRVGAPERNREICIARGERIAGAGMLPESVIEALRFLAWNCVVVCQVGLLSDAISSVPPLTPTATSLQFVASV